MKVRRGINPDYADFDEIDHDAEEAIEDFFAGQLSYESLRTLVGPDAAASYAEEIVDEEDLFDNPEEF